MGSNYASAKTQRSRSVSGERVCVMVLPLLPEEVRGGGKKTKKKQPPKKTRFTQDGKPRHQREGRRVSDELGYASGDGQHQITVDFAFVTLGTKKLQPSESRKEVIKLPRVCTHLCHDGGREEEEEKVYNKRLFPPTKKNRNGKN